MKRKLQERLRSIREKILVLESIRSVQQKKKNETSELISLESAENRIVDRLRLKFPVHVYTCFV